MNIVLRTCSAHDLKAYQAFAKEAPIGFTTLPKDPKLCKENLEHAILSFEKDVQTPNEELYLFVAEDVATRQILGISGIAATTGGKAPLYYFRKEIEVLQSQVDAVVKEQPMLIPVSYARGPTELCSLFVPLAHRKSGVGRLLSFGRFLYIKAHDARFTNTLFAELRGKIDKNKISPFWDAVGRNFFSKTFCEVLDMLQYGKGFIAEFLPKHPIYIKLLTQVVQACIEQVDVYTKGAYTMLQKLGFTKSGEIDVLDAGPRLVTTKETATILQKAKKVTVSSIKAHAHNDDYFVSTCNKKFRACYASCLLENDTVALSKKTAEILQVELGESVICYKWKKE